jgi:hypothetical protein
MADRGEAHAIKEADCLQCPVGSKWWSAWLKVTPNQRQHGGARGGSSGSMQRLSGHSDAEGGSRPSMSRAGKTWCHKEKIVSDFSDGVLQGTRRPCKEAQRTWTTGGDGGSDTRGGHRRPCHRSVTTCMDVR